MSEGAKKRAGVKVIDKLIDIGEAIAGATIVYDWIKKLLPIAQKTAETFTPEIAAKFKRNSQRTANGPVDEKNFFDAKMKLDGDDLTVAERPLADIIDNFLSYLEYMDPNLRTWFVYFVGLQVEDEQWRVNYLRRLAQVKDSTNGEKTLRANALRFEMAFNDGILKIPENELMKFMDEHPAIKATILGFPDMVKKTVDSVVLTPARNTIQALEEADRNILANDSSIGKATTSYRKRARLRAGR